MRLVASLLAVSMLAGCATTPLPTEAPTAEAPMVALHAPMSAREALAAYYDTIADSELPRAPQSRPLPASDAVIDRILVASCNDEEIESPALATIAAQEADLFLMVGDNVYGDRDGRDYANNQPDLTELRQSFADLGARPEFAAVRAAHAMMVAWDDHDYGANDAGGEFVFKDLAERVHEVFWHLEGEDVGQWPGTYYARSFGPDGQRVQVIILDTRFFRSELTASDARGEPGRERYMPAPEGSHQDMLGAAQWTWLENQLQEPADLRFIVSSIQVLTSDGHGFEHWNNLPAERDRLMELIGSTDANGVVFLSGDRHTAFLYRKEGVVDYPLHELTASSLNLSFREESPEMDSAQIGSGYALRNFGAVEIDWEARRVSLQILSETGSVVRQTSFPIPQ